MSDAELWDVWRFIHEHGETMLFWYVGLSCVVSLALAYFVFWGDG